MHACSSVDDPVLQSQDRRLSKAEKSVFTVIRETVNIPRRGWFIHLILRFLDPTSVIHLISFSPGPLSPSDALPCTVGRLPVNRGILGGAGSPFVGLRGNEEKKGKKTVIACAVLGPRKQLKLIKNTKLTSCQKV